MPRQRHLIRAWLHAVLLGGVLALAGCGGDPVGVGAAADGTDGAVGSAPAPGPVTEAPLQPPAAPVLSVSPQAIKTLNLSWGAVDGATHYQLLEDPTGTSGYTLLDTLDGQDVEHALELFLPERINARYLLEACNAAGCTASAAQSVAGTLDAAVGYVKAGVVSAGDQFGFAVALSGDGQTLAVGAPYEDGAGQGVTADPGQLGATDSGAVYLFTRTEQGWAQRAYLKASNAEAADQFGWAVALSADGRTLAVGARGEDSPSTQINTGEADNSQPGQGAVYVFVREGVQWAQQAYVKPASNSGSSPIFGGGTVGALFGSSVALSADGDRLAVGAPTENSNASGVNGDGNNSGAFTSGAVFLFSRAAGQWQQSSYIKAAHTYSGDRFGEVVALSDDGATLAVGTSWERGTSAGINQDATQRGAQSVGAAYVFVDGPTGWEQEAYIKASHPVVGQSFARQLALSGGGTTLAVGAPGDDSAAQGVLTDGPHDAGAVNSGAVYLYVRDALGWAQQAYVKPASVRPSAQFGSVVALNADGSRMIVGAPLDNGQDQGLYANPAAPGGSVVDYFGAAYLFDGRPSGWAQTHFFKSAHGGASVRFGEALALSAQGDVLAVAAPREASASAGVGGDPTDTSAPTSGAVYLY